MKTIIDYLKQFIKEDFNPFVYGYVLLLISSMIFLNYNFQIQHYFFITFQGNINHVIFFIFLNIIAYYGVLIPQTFIKKETYLFKNKRIWIKSFIIIIIISFASGISVNSIGTALFDNIPERIFFNKSLSQFRWFVIYFISLIILKLIYDRQSKGLYGMVMKTGKLQPYFIMLLIVFPLIVAASFFPDFQQAYPRFKPWKIVEVFSMSKGQLQLINEFFYGFNYISTELMFRGTLVVGMSALIGKQAILPMVTMYCVFHFGKPLGETISSVFGGYILGVIAYNTRNIWGGTILHLGIAYLMEVIAMLQYYLLINPKQ